jgi:hypothetical protein
LYQEKVIVFVESVKPYYHIDVDISHREHHKDWFVHVLRYFYTQIKLCFASRKSCSLYLGWKMPKQDYSFSPDIKCVVLRQICALYLGLRVIWSETYNNYFMEIVLYPSKGILLLGLQIHMHKYHGKSYRFVLGQRCSFS